VSDALPISTSGLVKRYGDIVAVNGVDLTVERGDVFGYLGPNGAGKTTLLRMLLGLIRPTSGSAKLFGRDPVVDGARALDGVAGFVEGPRFYSYLSGRKNLELLADYDLRQGRLWPLVLVWIAAGPVTIRELDAARAERIAPWG